VRNAWIRSTFTCGVQLYNVVDGVQVYDVVDGVQVYNVVDGRHGPSAAFGRLVWGSVAKKNICKIQVLRARTGKSEIWIWPDGPRQFGNFKLSFSPFFPFFLPLPSSPLLLLSD